MVMIDGKYYNIDNGKEVTQKEYDEFFSLNGIGEVKGFDPTTSFKHKKRPRVVAKSKLDRIKLAWKMLTKGWIYVRE